jgi:hypothetical protein
VAYHCVFVLFSLVDPIGIEPLVAVLKVCTLDRLEIGVGSLAVVSLALRTVICGDSIEMTYLSVGDVSSLMAAERNKAFLKLDDVTENTDALVVFTGLIEGLQLSHSDGR